MEKNLLSLGIISSASAQDYLLLKFREHGRQEEVLENKDEEAKESEVDEKVKEVRENAQHVHATWRCKRKHLEPMCYVPRMGVSTTEKETDYEDCNTTRMLTCAPNGLNCCTHC